MYSYTVSFSIKADQTYSDRYDSLMKQLRSEPGIQFWDETTSFVLVQSPETIDVFANRLYFRSLLVASIDTLLVIDHSSSACIARGPIKYPFTLNSHFKACDIL